MGYMYMLTPRGIKVRKLQLIQQFLEWKTREYERLKEELENNRIKDYSVDEMFGKAKEVLQNENTPFHPCSPYVISKVAGFDLTRNYREAYGIFAFRGLLFNHESPRRGFEFVTRLSST